MSELAIGIDLGTTHSVVALFETDGPRVLADARGTQLVPSVVALDDTGRVLVGEAALERRKAGFSDTVARFKTTMGDDTTYTLGDRQLSATSLSALVLREMKDLASEALGVPVESAVISVPAWFREPQRQATVEAAHLAGLKVLRLVNEPTAAALEHGLRADGEPVVVAVLDLGGGTLDLSVLELFDGVADVLASVGDVQLGGEDATDLLVQWVLRQLAAPPIDPVGRARVEHAAERAKRALSVQDVVEVPFANEVLTLDRAQLAAVLGPWTHRIRQCLQSVRGHKGYQSPDVVLLVGGAAQMPLVADLAREIFGVEPVPWHDGDVTVAKGAAVQAGLVLDHVALRDHLVSDVLTHSLGVDTVRRVGDQMLSERFDPILSRGTTLPASRVSTYSTLHHEQSKVVFQIYEGEHREVSRNQHLGSLAIDELPPLPEGEVHDLEVRFTHDVSGLLEVQARRAGEETWASLVLQRGGDHFDDAAVRAKLAELAPLKTHPRDLLPNRWAFERGTRVLTWVTGPRRQHLDQLLDAFEAAMQRQDGGAIAVLREAVERETRTLVDTLGLELDA